ncbi:MAG: hypothetical protein ACW97P_11885 [Candidatus Hodarchaeales archaeon]|jgi:hypothetical protein
MFKEKKLIIAKVWIASDDNGASWEITKVDSIGGIGRMKRESLLGLKLLRIDDY